MKYREVLERLRRFGVKEDKERGKGSERLLIREEPPGSGKGRRATIKCHGEGKDVPKGTLAAVLRRLRIDRKDFLS